jgi:predicted transcriptional regulator
MNILLERANFKITNIILSQKEEFTVEDVINEVSEKNLNADKDFIITTIKNLRDSGLINDYGAKYTLSSLMVR